MRALHGSQALLSGGEAAEVLEEEEACACRMEFVVADSAIAFVIESAPGSAVSRYSHDLAVDRVRAVVDGARTKECLGRPDNGQLAQARPRKVV